MTRNAVVPFYRDLIVKEANDREVKRINDLILSKWTPSGLLYIKNKAWTPDMMAQWRGEARIEGNGVFPITIFTD